VLTPYLPVLLLSSSPPLLFPTYSSTLAFVCVYLPFSDYLDGQMARHLDMSTPLGSFLDPLADKFLITTLALTLLCSDVEAIKPEVIGLWIARDVGLLGMGVAVIGVKGILGVADGGSSDVKGVNVSGKKLEVQASMVSKVNTTAQMLALSGGVAIVAATKDPTVMSEGVLKTVEMGVEFCATTSIFTTVASGIGYVDGSSVKGLH